MEITRRRWLTWPGPPNDLSPQTEAGDRSSWPVAVRMMTQVVLIRPGATLYDEQHRVQGVLDVPLSDRGRAEVEELAEKLAGLELTALYCGPGESVVRTADVVGKSLGLRPKRVEELRNLD